VAINNIQIYNQVNYTNPGKQIYAIAAGATVNYAQPYIFLDAGRYHIRNNYMLNDNNAPTPGYCSHATDKVWFTISTQDVSEWVGIILQGVGVDTHKIKTFKVMYTINGRDWFYVDN
jgi:hypothetical protein